MCSSWSCESNTVEGWAFGLGNLEPNPILATTSVRAAVGSFSIFAPVSTLAWVQVPVCAGIGANMAGKSFHAQVYLDTHGVAFDNASQSINQVYVNLTTDPNIPPFGAKTGVLQAYLDPAPGTALFIANEWNSLDGKIPSDTVTPQAAVIEIGIQFGSVPAIYTQATLYVDDVKIF